MATHGFIQLVPVSLGKRESKMKPKRKNINETAIEFSLISGKSVRKVQTDIMNNTNAKYTEFLISYKRKDSGAWEILR